MRSRLLCLLILLLIPAAASAQATGNLLRNGRFQDDWITLLPQNKNHHWCYADGFYNRRDYNPDGWFLSGSWDWQNADAPPGQRRLVLTGPAEVVQRVNWVTVHDDRSREGFPDAGGFPGAKPQRSLKPLRLVRDVTFRVKIKGSDVPANAGNIEVAWCPPGGISSSDPMGTPTPPTVSASAVLPTGTFDAKWIEVKLPAAAWLKAVKDAAAKDSKETAEIAKSGPVLPGTARVTIRTTAKTGRVEVEAAELLAVAPESPNLLANGGFEELDKNVYPVGWSEAVKYRYFPPGHYYIFNTWHNSAFENRGLVPADTLIVHRGSRSLQMIVPPGDEKAVVSAPVILNQKEPNLIEVSAWAKTDRLCMLEIDAVNEKGERIDCFNFIHKAPVSIGTDDWRQVRQVFRPRTPVKSLRLQLCARGVNGYTLEDTSPQPQNAVVGTIWWDDIHLTEPESTAADLAARGVKSVKEKESKTAPHLEDLDVGERMLGKNTLTATLVNPGAARTIRVGYKLYPPIVLAPKKSTTQKKVEAFEVPAGGRVLVRIPILLEECFPEPHTEYRMELNLVGEYGQDLDTTHVWFAPRETPIDLRLGALYLRPGQKQFVRMNLGFSSATMAEVKAVRLEIIRRSSGQVLKSVDVPATPAAIKAQRGKIPADLRGDLSNLLLADLDVSALPLQPFSDPQRNWFVRATVLDTDGKPMGSADSPPFCRLDHEAKQPPVGNVTIKNGMVHIDGKPWIAWGACYGHVPVYAGPADPGSGKYRDLHNLPAWSIYDGFTPASYTRKDNDFNCLRYVAGSITDPKVIDKHWQDDNLYCSSAFVVPGPVFSVEELFKAAGGKDKLDAYLAMSRKSPAIVSLAAGIEEAFGLFHENGPGKLKGLEAAVDYLRKNGGKPVMVGHGGYWNRLEFEKVPFFDIYDPETEPLYPANLHTDLAPLLKGKDRAIWLRPQMYEDVPYERWRFHAFVELMRGCRGWQFAHGPGDASLFRGLHGEMRFFEPIVASTDAGPAVSVEPWIEHWSRRHNGKLYVIAATTRGIGLGHWEDDIEVPGGKPFRITNRDNEVRDETNAYGVGGDVERGPSAHGVQYLPNARAWPKGSKLVQWVRLDAKALPRNLVVLAKADGRWTHAAAWGKFDPATLRRDPKLAYWFLNSFYRHAKGFLGWDTRLVEKALPYLPERAADLGALPEAGRWVKLETPLEKIAAIDKLLDGVGFLHEGGRVAWGHTSIVAPDGAETVIWGDALELPPAELAKVKIKVAGLKAGTKVRVLFEDRELTAADGSFIDDFRGQDLYQRFGGGYGRGYGDGPVALHLYEVPL
jgi:hypothetical protein